VTDHRILIALGGNLPSAALSLIEMIPAALHKVQVRLGAQALVSRLYQTPAFPTGSGPDYLNAAAVLTLPPAAAPLTAAEILAHLHAVEALFDRERTSRWAGRTLDLDLLALGSQILPSPEVQSHWRHLDAARQRSEAPQVPILPHPRLQDRAFVLVPLAEVAPDWVHPLLGQSVLQMLALLPPNRLDGIKLL
jgi:2-amino-4-hydroxy-6-hydroxymethyldihydropteridine diphosphokinase